MESKDDDYWSFLDVTGYYLCDTTLLSKDEISSEEIAITRSIGFQTGERYNDPDVETIAYIKKALQEYKDWGVISDYKHCQLTLIDAINGKDI